MIKTFLCSAAFVIVGAPVFSEELHVFTWADYMAENTVANFEAETGIDVVLTYFDSVPTMETRILTGGSGFDVVMSAASSVERFATSDLLADLSNAGLTNLGNLDTSITERLRAYDGAGFYSVPYMWGATGVGYNVAKVEALAPGVDLSDLNSFFDPAVMAKLAECGIAFIDSPNEVISTTLNFLGHAPETDVQAEVDEALALLQGIRPSVRYINSVKIIDDLASGEICVAFTYSGDAATAGWAASEAGNGIEIKFAIPQQGTGLWIDVWNVLADAPNPDAATKFLDYLMRPQVIADISNTVYYANANSASTDLVLPEITSDPSLYPTEEVKQNLYPSLNLPNDAQRQRTRAWTTFKTGV